MKKVIITGIAAVVFSCTMGAASAYEYRRAEKMAAQAGTCACTNCSCDDCSCTDCANCNCEEGCCDGGSDCSK